ncbi:MAG: hypothetical protein MGG11_08460 [Trichodesmium sp. MAG_R03]|nr:hypothetical protein [Trichodesmium sp. MAG_R03]
MKSLGKKIQKERVEVDKKLRSLKSEIFACQADAETATRKLLKKFLYHEFQEINVQFVESKSNKIFPVLGARGTFHYRTPPQLITDIKYGSIGII